MPSLTGVRHRFVDLPGVRLHVAEAGTGDPVLLLHGFPQHWWEWRSVLLPLAEHARVLAPDLRGAGWSAAPSAGYDAESLQGDVIALLDEFGLDRVHLISHDWGALLGFRLCLTHPERVRTHLALATPHPFVRFHAGLAPHLWRLWFQPIVAAPVVGPRLLGGGAQRLPRHLLTAYAADPATWSIDDLAAFLRPLTDAGHARAGSAVYRRFILPEAGRILSGRYRGERLRTRTLVLVGDRDPLSRPEFLGDREGRADDLRVEQVRDAAHFLADERPDAVVAAALGLLAAA